VAPDPAFLRTEIEAAKKRLSDDLVELRSETSRVMGQLARVMAALAIAYVGQRLVRSLWGRYRS
jgi:hypothetical protein